MESPKNLFEIVLCADMQLHFLSPRYEERDREGQTGSFLALTGKRERSFRWAFLTQTTVSDDHVFASPRKYESAKRNSL